MTEVPVLQTERLRLRFEGPQEVLGLATVRYAVHRRDRPGVDRLAASG